MRQRAEYIGAVPMFGVTPGETREIDVFTIDSEHGTPYLWVRVAEKGNPDGDGTYMMPYVSVPAMLGEWRFCEERDARDWHRAQDELVDRWIRLYTPAEEPAVGTALPAY